jgi:hypothetical protein
VNHTAIDGTALVDTASEAWTRAAASAGIVRRFYRWGRHVVCVEFAGRDLLPVLTPALVHREIEPVANPSLTIAAWVAGRSMHEAFPMEPLWHDGRDREKFTVGVARSRATISMLDRSAARGYFWAPRAGAIPPWMAGSPWRSILHWWWRPLGLQMVHAAAIAVDGAAVLLAGPGGAGKSTTTFACLRQGLDVLGEDHCLVAVDPPVTAFGLYCAGKLTDDALSAFPDLCDMVRDLPGTLRCEPGKQLFFPGSRYRPRFPERAPIKAMLIPAIVDRRTPAIVPASRAEGVRAIAPSTLFQLPGAGDHDLRQLARLAGHLPTYRLELGRDLDRAAAVIASFLSA